MPGGSWPSPTRRSCPPSTPLEAEYGSREEALKAFEDFIWLEDPKAITTIPRDEGTFSNQPEPAAGREAVFRQMAQWALTLPQTLAKGPGTGDSSAPPPCSQPSLGGPAGGAGGLGGSEVGARPKASKARAVEDLQ